MKTASKRDGLLRKALVANGVFSTVCAFSGLTFSAEIAGAMGLSSALPVQAVAGGLLPFAGFVFWQARREQLSGRDAMLTIVGDLGWVLGTDLLLLGWPELMNTTGQVSLILIAAFVGLWAVLQALGLRRLRQNDRPGPRSLMSFERIVPVGVDRAWAVISDVDGYHRYAPSLEFSRIDEGEGLNARRSCGDAKGSWSERCTLWEEGHRYVFEVDTGAEDYPYPFEELRGEWSVEPVDEGRTRVRMRFEATMPGGILGELMLAATADAFDAAGEGVLDRWEDAMLERSAPRLHAA
jgi:ribosome-associated toxin RatA of RatAB toxin-antitoxin module